MNFLISEIADIIEAQSHTLLFPITAIDQIETDTRNLKNCSPNTLFIALKGSNHNAHQFIEKALQAGIKNFIVQQKTQAPNTNIWQVENTTDALQKLAQAHRKKFDLPIIALTGSNGKTIVKEWLNHLLKHDFDIVRSPKSYNSQVGVALSLLKINTSHTLGIFEAGISQVGEMEKLQKMIQATWGVFTHIGTAHSEGFENEEQKITEKLNLFTHCKGVILPQKLSNYSIFKNLLQQKNIPILNSNLTIFAPQIEEKHTLISFQYQTKNHTIAIPFTSPASIGNAVLCLKVICALVPQFDKWNLFANLPVISMRLELKKGINQTYIINDTYNADFDSLEIALLFLDRKAQGKKSLILSDITGMNEDENLRKRLLKLLKKQSLSTLICVGKAWNLLHNELKNQHFDYHHFDTSQLLVAALNSLNISNETILIKGERRYNLEQIAEILSIKRHETTLEINLDAIVANLAYFRTQLLPNTQIMVMVKSFAYGVGALELAQVLQYQKVAYLGVAYTDEGLELRAGGITLPIMVMNPSFEQMSHCVAHQLEPVFFSFNQVQNWLQSNAYNPQLPLHIKLNTGMNRLGFDEQEVQKLLHLLSHQTLYIKSILSHLAASDEIKNKAITLEQITKFEALTSKIDKALKYKTIKHLLNSNGILNFKSAQFDMVRLGLGLYGYTKNENLKPCLQLKTFITQIRDVPKNAFIGYGVDTQLQQATTVATIAIGYADGLMRKAGNGNFKVLIKDKLYPTIGNICMDMCMINLDNNPHGIQLNDEVIIFDEHYSIEHLAQSCQTISYEIMTHISQRVKRVYWQEHV